MRDIELGPSPISHPARPTPFSSRIRTLFCTRWFRIFRIFLIFLILTLCSVSIAMAVYIIRASKTEKEGLVARKNKWAYHEPSPTPAPMSPEELEILRDFLTRPGR